MDLRGQTEMVRARVGATEANRDDGRCMLVHREVRLVIRRIRVVSQRLLGLCPLFYKQGTETFLFCPYNMEE